MSPQPTTMKAIVQPSYGTADVLRLADVPVPTLDDDTILVRVRAASVNALDWRSLSGFTRLFGSGMRRPQRQIPGMDLAGRVEAVGRNVTEFAPGDEVIGHKSAAFAEYVRGKPGNFVPKPARLSFEQAAAIPVAGLTALQGLRDVGGLQAGQSVLVNGASGGVGSFAVQIAKALGARVTAVCDPRGLDLVRSLGADRVIDRTKEDFVRGGERYDVIFDVRADRSLSDHRRALTPRGVLVMAGAPHGFAAILLRLLAARIRSRKDGQRLSFYMARHDKDDLLLLARLADEGKLTPVVTRTYRLSEAPQAVRDLAAAKAQGKVVVIP